MLYRWTLLTLVSNIKIIVNFFVFIHLVKHLLATNRYNLLFKLSLNPIDFYNHIVKSFTSSFCKFKFLYHLLQLFVKLLLSLFRCSKHIFLLLDLILAILCFNNYILDLSFLLLILIFFPCYLLLFVIHLSFNVIKLFFVILVLVLQIVFLTSQLFYFHYKVSEYFWDWFWLSTLWSLVLSIYWVIEVVSSITCFMNCFLNRVFMGFV